MVEYSTLMGLKGRSEVWNNGTNMVGEVGIGIFYEERIGQDAATCPGA